MAGDKHEVPRGQQPARLRDRVPAFDAAADAAAATITAAAAAAVAAVAAVVTAAPATPAPDSTAAAAAVQFRLGPRRAHGR